MILVDTSIWIDHLHSPNRTLVDLLGRDEIAGHPLVVQELALGSMHDRRTVIDSLNRLTSLPSLSHVEMLALVEGRRLWDRGLNLVDVHLLGAVMVSPGVSLWTRDRRLRRAAADVGCALT